MLGYTTLCVLYDDFSSPVTGNETSGEESFTYVMSSAAGVPTLAASVGTSTLSLTGSQAMPKYLQLVGSPQVLTPAVANALLLQQQTAMAYNSAPKIAPKPYPVKSYTLNGGHIVTRNDNGQLKCPYCKFESNSFEGLRTHSLLHPRKCKLCDQTFVDELKLKEHFERQHEGSVSNLHFFCPVCHKELSSKSGLKYHLKKQHIGDFQYFCEVCCKGFQSQMHYDNHVKNHLRAYQYKCSNCGMELTSWATFTRHRATCIPSSTETNNLMCDLCGDEFFTEPHLNEHIDCEHSDLPRYKCTCGEQFRIRQRFNTHRISCNYIYEKSIVLGKAADESNTSDGLSNLAIVNVESLNDKQEGENQGNFIQEDSNDSIQITNVESGEQFNVDIKPSTFQQAYSQSLKTKMHACQFCEYKTPKLSHLKRHELTHLKKPAKPAQPRKSNLPAPTKPRSQGYYHARYKCDKCSRTFSSKGGIAYHQQTKHNLAYKYKCETCDKGFNTYQHFVGHKNTHTGVRPYVCPSCNIGFSYPSVLTSHRRVCKGKAETLTLNGGLDYYPCKHCFEKFALPTALQDHMKEVHSSSIMTSYLCDCGEDFQLRALYDLHKTSCKKMDMSSAMILEAVETEMSQELGDDHNLQEITEAVANNQPVFPT